MWTSNKTRFFVLYSRTLVWATSKHNVYLMSHFLGEATSGKHKVLSVQSHVSPAKVSFSSGTMKDSSIKIYIR